MIKTTNLILAVLCAPILVQAREGGESDQTATLKAPQAITAINEETAAEKRAQESYVQAIVAAKRRCIRELDSALNSVMQSGNLNEANKISLAKKQLSGEIDDLIAAQKSPPSTQPALAAVYLDERQEDSYTGTQWALSKHGTIHKMLIAVGGKTYSNGMGLNPSDGASAAITYSLPAGRWPGTLAK